MWSLIGGFSGLARIAIGGACAWVVMSLIIVPMERADAVRGKVDEFRATAAEAERDELRRQLTAGNIVIEAYQAQLRNVRAKEEATANEVERQIAENEALRAASGRVCALDDADVEFLRKR